MNYIIAGIAIVVYIPVLLCYAIADFWEFKMKPWLKSVV